MDESTREYYKQLSRTHLREGRGAPTTEEAMQYFEDRGAVVDRSNPSSPTISWPAGTGFFE